MQAAYHKLWEGKSLTSCVDIVQYFKEVLIIRTNLNLNRYGISFVCATVSRKSPWYHKWGSRYAGTEAYFVGF